MRLPGLNAVVALQWEDPNCQHEEMAADEVADLSTKDVFTYGRVVRVTETHVTVASEELHMPPSVTYRCVTVVPVGSIRAVLTYVPDP